MSCGGCDYPIHKPAAAARLARAKVAAHVPRALLYRPIGGPHVRRRILCAVQDRPFMAKGHALISDRVHLVQDSGVRVLGVRVCQRNRG